MQNKGRHVVSAIAAERGFRQIRYCGVKFPQVLGIVLNRT